MQANRIIYITIQHLAHRVAAQNNSWTRQKVFYNTCLHNRSCVLSNLQPREEGLKGVDPGVHYFTTEHIHINIQRWVTLSFITRLSSGKTQR